MGEVDLAADTNLGRQVAVKVLPDAFAQDAERVARFAREARTLASLSHPNDVTADGQRLLMLVPGDGKDSTVHALASSLSSTGSKS